MKTFAQFVTEANSVQTARIKARHHRGEGDKVFNDIVDVYKNKREDEKRPELKKLNRKADLHGRARDAADNIVNKHDWGYHGEAMRAHGVTKAKDLTRQMRDRVVKHIGIDAAAAGDFLQSRMGRHLHDSLSGKNSYSDSDMNKTVSQHFRHYSKSK